MSDDAPPDVEDAEGGDPGAENGTGLQAALAGQQWLLWLVIAGVLNSALSLFYYLRVIRNIYTEDPQGGARPFGGHTRYISFAVLLMLALLIPLQYDSILAVCREAAASLL